MRLAIVILKILKMHPILFLLLSALAWILHLKALDSPEGPSHQVPLVRPKALAQNAQLSS